MAQEKGGGETGTECGVDKGVGDGWVVMWPGRDLVFEVVGFGVDELESGEFLPVGPTLDAQSGLLYDLAVAAGLSLCGCVA